MKMVGVTGLGGLWALKWAWHSAEVNMRCAGISRICMPNPNFVAFIVSEITSLIRTDIARSTWLARDPDQEYKYILDRVENACV